MPRAADGGDVARVLTSASAVALALLAVGLPAAATAGRRPSGPRRRRRAATTTRTRAACWSAPTAPPLRQRLPAGATVEAKALADYVRIDPGRGYDPTRPDADRRAPDAVTSASATAGGGEVASKWRFEGQLGADLERDAGRRARPALGAAGARPAPSPTTSRSRWPRGARASCSIATPPSRCSSATAGTRSGRSRRSRGQEALWPDDHQPLGRQPVRRAAPVAHARAQRRPGAPPGSGACSRAPTAGRWCGRTCCCPRRCRARAIATPGFVGLSLSLRPDLALHLQPGRVRSTAGRCGPSSPRC